MSVREGLTALVSVAIILAVLAVISGYHAHSEAVRDDALPSVPKLEPVRTAALVIATVASLAWWGALIWVIVR